MSTNDNRQIAHNEIDHIFKDLPFLSAVLMKDGMMAQPLRTVIRKGKSHYVCDERLERRLKQIQSSRSHSTELPAVSAAGSAPEAR